MTSGGGKVALVTGGGRRIGAAVSRALGKAGYDVVLTYRSSRGEAAAIAREVGGAALPLDLSRPASFRRFAGHIRESRGRLDLLVHNALGSTLAALMLGPTAAIIVMSTVLIVQAFLFADGGILALGPNIFNMAIVGPLAGYGVYRLLRVVFRGEYGRLVAVGVASWFSTVTAAIVCAGELAWSGTVSWNAAFPAMAGEPPLPWTGG